MQTVMNILGQGLGLAAIYLLSALGLTVIYGVMGVINLAHGELIMVGSYVVALTAGTLSIVGAVVAACVLVAALGVALELLVVRHLYQKPMASMLGTWGIALVIRQTVILLFGTQLRYVALPIGTSFAIGFGATLQWWYAILIGAGALAALCLGLIMSRTRFGMQMRAVIADPGTAETLGLRVGRINLGAFALGCGLAGLAGAMLAPLETVYPEMGVQYLVAAFLVVVLAGLGNIRSTIMWSVAVGIGFAAIAVPFNDTLANIVVWGGALLVIASRRRALVVARV